ncbi:rCG62703 [Rattus norvegicus]|uniref:RCG62703 n=1 Tax=Rattus norvegicus TaxID=10116 RepID=A6J5X5_RAT|nr:rCG62703 [Rattus norvegicus]
MKFKLWSSSKRIFEIKNHSVQKSVLNLPFLAV